MRLIIKNFDEGIADCFALAFGVYFVSQGFQKTLGSINAFYVQPHILVLVEHAFKFVFTKQSVVYKYAIQIFADGFIQQNRRNGRINSAAQTENNFSVANLLFQSFNGSFYKSGGRPRLFNICNVYQKVFEQSLSVGCVIYFWVELDCVSFLALNSVGSVQHITRTCQTNASFWKLRNSIAVAHPNVCVFGNVFEEILTRFYH